MAKESFVKGVPERAFGTAQLVKLGDPIERPVTLSALQVKSTGVIFVFPEAFVSGAAVKVLADTLNAERIGVKGKWVFVPEEEEEE